MKCTSPVHNHGRFTPGTGITLVITLCLLFALLAGGCSDNDGGPRVPENHAGWSRTTDVELDYPIPGHESHYRRIYINETGENYTVTEKDGRVIHDYPKGTIIIKDIYPDQTYREGDEPVMQTVMIKDPEHEQNRGGWLWIVKDLGSGTETVMDDPFCLTCHSNANEEHPYGDKNTDEEYRDYVFFPPDKK